MSEIVKVLSNEYLKGIMSDAMVERGLFFNIDELLIPGIYIGAADMSTGTYPTDDVGWKFCTLEVIPARNPRVVQRITSETGEAATRVWISSYWTPWKMLT